MSNIIPFQFNGQDVPAIRDEHGEPWWKASDVCDALGNCQGIHKEMAQAYLSLLDMLAITSDIQDYCCAKQFLAWLSSCAVACKIDTKSFWQLYGVILEHLVLENRRSKVKPDEYFWHEVFQKHLETLIPGAIFTPRRFKKGDGAPDFLVKVNKDICPVEIKRDSFNEAAVRQLRGYISRFKSPYGFAVAQDCSAPLDHNMVFVSLEGLGKC